MWRAAVKSGSLPTSRCEHGPRSAGVLAARLNEEHPGVCDVPNDVGDGLERQPVAEPHQVQRVEDPRGGALGRDEERAGGAGRPCGQIALFAIQDLTPMCVYSLFKT